MELSTARQRVNGRLAEYARPGWRQHMKDIKPELFPQLDALDPEKATAQDIAEIVGYDQGGRCTECRGQDLDPTR